MTVSKTNFQCVQRFRFVCRFNFFLYWRNRQNRISVDLNKNPSKNLCVTFDFLLANVFTGNVYRCFIEYNLNKVCVLNQLDVWELKLSMGSSISTVLKPFIWWSVSCAKRCGSVEARSTLNTSGQIRENSQEEYLKVFSAGYGYVHGDSHGHDRIDPRKYHKPCSWRPFHICYRRALAFFRFV